MTVRQIDNWDDIQEKQDGEFPSPAPGGYVAVIVNVEDNEEKQYLRIEWDYADGAYKGENAATFARAGFWPTTLFRSYKDSALGFFKGFKTAVELSNPGYTFDCRRPQALAGKAVGLVLGEEEYVKGTGEIAARLYVAQTRTVKAIRERDYKVPPLKKLNPAAGTDKPAGQFQPYAGDDDDCPF